MPGDPMHALVAGLFGLLFGSFLNVCIARWPAGQSVVRPRSRCPGCGGAIAAHDNIPVVSWLLLRGRCRQCQAPISSAYPLVELAAGAIWAWSAWRWGVGFEALTWALFATILLGIAMTDAREFIIPHEFSFGGLALGLVLAFVDGLGDGLTAVHGAVIGAGIVYLIGVAGEFVFKKEAMGGGDVAMMAMVGAFLGWQSAIATLFLGAFVGVLLHGITLLVRRGAAPLPEPSEPRSTDDMTPEELRAAGYLPFGVSLAIAAALIALVTGPAPVNQWFADYAAMLGL